MTAACGEASASLASSSRKLAVRAGTYVHLMPSADDRMRQAVDAAFASSDGPATAQAVRR